MFLEQLWAHMTLSAAFLFEKRLAHPWPSVEFFGSTNGPIHSFRQHVSEVTLGPYDTIGSISFEKRLVHPWSLAEFFGPMDLFTAIGSFTQE